MYYTYMLRCEDNSIYTGISTDIKRRLKEHKEKLLATAGKYKKINTPTNKNICGDIMFLVLNVRNVVNNNPITLKTKPR